MLKRILPLLLVLVIMLAGCGKSDADIQNNTYEKISMSEGLARMESDENYILLDVRRADEFEAGHIPGAVNLPNEEIGTSMMTPKRKYPLNSFRQIGNVRYAVRQRQILSRKLLMGKKKSRLQYP